MRKIASTAASLGLIDALMIGLTCMIFGGDPQPLVDGFWWFAIEGVALVIMVIVWSLASRADRLEAVEIYNDPFHKR